MSKSQPKHWYYIYITYCILGGETEETRERRYTPRPEAWEDRHEIDEIACYGCQYEMFL